ncbi:MAG: hypothetical protein II694_04075 [Lachnospiraceae bacterium]|nr:hypothetical protein [Lachnospiraceae bacterium]
MKNKFFNKVVGLLLALVLLILTPTGVVDANAASKNIKDYASVSTGSIENVILCSSRDDFEAQIEMGATPLFMPSKTEYSTFNVTFKENGYMFFKGTGYSYSNEYTKVYRDASLTTLIAEYDCQYSKTVTGFFPVEAGTYYFSRNYMKSIYIGFVPASDVISIEGREQKNKSVYLDIKSLEKKTKINAVALDGTKSSASCIKTWLEGDYACTVKDNVATILLPEPGKYTVMVDTEYTSGNHNKIVYHIDTDELLKNNKKLKTPISILAGTNAIVGEATPGSTIYATYGGVDYSVKVDSSGIYRLKVGKMKKKKSVKMWQVENGKTTAEGTFKVVTKY